MKKKLLSAILCLTMVATMVVGCSSSTEEVVEETTEEVTEEAAADTYTVGITVQSLQNDYWAGVMGKLETVLTDAGWDYTLIDCDDNSATQISQIENFITTGVDLIMVHPSDADAVEDVCAQAMDAGIKVMCWDNSMANTDANWVLDNTDLGYEIGAAAAEFINEYYTADDPAEVVVIGYPSTTVLLERANGIKSGLEDNCDEGNYVIVAETEGIESNDAQTNCETVLQAYPDASVFVGVGSGACIGANEALLQYYGGAGSIPEDVGVITTDVTETQLNSILAGDEAVRCIIGFEGSSLDTAEACFAMFEDVMSGAVGDNEDVYRPFTEIGIDTVEEILAGM